MTISRERRKSRLKTAASKRARNRRKRGIVDLPFSKRRSIRIPK